MSEESTINPERLIFLLQYIGADYGAAVQDKSVVNEAEYDEILDFSGIVKDWLAETYIDRPDEQDLLRVKELREAILNKASWAEVRALTAALQQNLTAKFNVIPYPPTKPDLGDGKYLYGIACSQCHGESGDGRGRSAGDLNPAPGNFRKPELSNKATPHQFFNTITFGVEGTAMPSHQEAFTDKQRWNIAFYLMTLRAGFAPKRPPEDLNLSVKDLSVRSNEDLLVQLESRGDPAGGSSDSVLFGWIDYLRQNPPQMSLEDRLAIAQKKLNKSFAAYANGDMDKALALSIDAYMDGVEPVEPLLAEKDKSLVTKVEIDFSRYREAIRSGLAVGQVRQRYRNLNRTLASLPTELETPETQWQFVLVQSITIILREGIEAALLIALMLTYLVSSGYRRLKKFVVAGAVAGIAAGVVMWSISELFFAISPFQQEAMEGFTSLLAAAVLFSVSFWIIHKLDIEHWKSYIRGKAERAVGTGSGFALALAAFLAVFREAFETVLFYQVLWLKSEALQPTVIAGFVLGSVALAAIVIALFKIGLKFPLKPFFSVTGVLLGLLAFVFSGYGVRELQNVGLLGETVLPWNFHIVFLEIHPTLEGVALQSGILLSFLFGWLSLLIGKLESVRCPGNSTI
jgi:high-affinity iron transporter